MTSPFSSPWLRLAAGALAVAAGTASVVVAILLVQSALA
jgi:hypothetical protein